MKNFVQIIIGSSDASRNRIKEKTIKAAAISAYCFYYGLNNKTIDMETIQNSFDIAINCISDVLIDEIKKEISNEYPASINEVRYNSTYHMVSSISGCGGLHMICVYEDNHTFRILGHDCIIKYNADDTIDITACINENYDRATFNITLTDSRKGIKFEKDVFIWSTKGILPSSFMDWDINKVKKEAEERMN